LSTLTSMSEIKKVTKESGITYVTKLSGKIVDTSVKRKKIDPEIVATALGADLSTALPVSNVKTVLSKEVVISRLLERVRSIGGRPGLSGTEARPKIPLTAEDLKNLQLSTEIIAKSGQNVDKGQVASILLSKALEEFVLQNAN
jgi:hypothetical protein